MTTLFNTLVAPDSNYLTFWSNVIELPITNSHFESQKQLNSMKLVNVPLGFKRMED